MWKSNKSLHDCTIHSFLNKFILIGVQFDFLCLFNMCFLLIIVLKTMCRLNSPETFDARNVALIKYAMFRNYQTLKLNSGRDEISWWSNEKLNTWAIDNSAEFNCSSCSVATRFYTINWNILPGRMNCAANYKTQCEVTIRIVFGPTW